MNREYRKHVKGMFSNLVIYSGVIFVLLILLSIFLFEVVGPTQKEYTELCSVSYKKIVESNMLTNEYNPVRKLDNIISFSNYGQRINSNVYIDNGNNPLCDIKLENGQIAVSQKMAHKLNVSEGDLIFASFPIYSEMIEYKVVKILPYMSDLYNVVDNQDFSYAFIGYDENLYNQAQGKMVYFLTEADYNTWMQNDYSYTNHYDIAEETNTIFYKLILWSCVYSIILIIVMVSAAMVFHKEINKEVLKYYYEGFSIKFVKTIDALDYFLFFGIPVLIYLGVVIILWNLNYIGVFLFVSNIFIGLISLLITVFIGGGKYGRAD